MFSRVKDTERTKRTIYLQYTSFTCHSARLML